MIIGFLSDTHENIEMIKKAVLFFNEINPNLVIHLGDICSPIMGNYFKELKSPLKVIFGNNDGDKDFLRVKFNYAEMFHGPHEFIVENKKILCMHQPEFVDVFAKSGEYKLIAHGHTHIMRKEILNDTLIINPGEVMGALSGISSIAIYNSNENEVRYYDLNTKREIDVK
ncbi:metallophosphoesterase [bacterium]|nr:metallophosphoesterase [bacterium]